MFNFLYEFHTYQFRWCFQCARFLGGDVKHKLDDGGDDDSGGGGDEDDDDEVPR